MWLTTAQVSLGRRPHAFFQAVETGAKKRYCSSSTKSAKWKTTSASATSRFAMRAASVPVLGMERGRDEEAFDTQQEIKPSK